MFFDVLHVPWQPGHTCPHPARRQTGNLTFLTTAIRMSDWFILALPTHEPGNPSNQDIMPPWDFDAPSNVSYRDTSAAAIAVCGLFDLSHTLAYLTGQVNDTSLQGLTLPDAYNYTTSQLQDRAQGYYLTARALLRALHKPPYLATLPVERVEVPWPKVGGG